MIVLCVPTVKLQDESFSGHQALIFIAPMTTRAAKQLSIPGADCRDIVNADEGCKLHF